MITRLLKQFFERRGFVLGGDLNKNDRAGALHRAWGHVFSNQILGDYVEFGVYTGESFIESYRQYKLFDRWLKGQLESQEEWRRTVARNFSNREVHFHGLDTFAGMPGNSENNVTFSEGTFVSSLPKVRDKCLSAGMETSFFSLYCGLFSDTKTSLIEHLSPRIAIVNIDCDLKSSTVDALAAIRDRLQVGCVFMFDDFNAFCADNSQGERRAFRDFCNDVRFKFEPWFSYHYAGQAFLCVED